MGAYKANKKNEKQRAQKNAEELYKEGGAVALKALGMPGPAADKASEKLNKTPGQRNTAKMFGKIATKNPLAAKVINKVGEDENLKKGLKGLAGGQKGKIPDGSSGEQSPLSKLAGANKKTPNGPQFGKNLMDEEEGLSEETEQSGLSILGGSATKGASKAGSKAASKITAKGTASIKIKFYLTLAGIGVAIFGIVFIIALFSTIIGPFEPMASLDSEMGDDLGGMGGAFGTSEEEKEFTENLMEIQKKYNDEEEKDISVKAITSTFIILQSYDTSFTYKDMSKSEMKKVADLLVSAKEELEDSSDDEKVQSKTKEKLADYFEEKIPGKTRESYLKMADEVYEHIKNYEEFINMDDNSSSLNSSTGRMCTYNVHGKSYTNLKIRLMQAGEVRGHTCGGTYGEPMVGEELVDFEKYVLGVGYAEHGGAPEEAFKAQLIFARTYSLNRPSAVGNTYGRKFVKENGQDILQITNCVSDQVYCDPDQGCSKDVPANDQYGMVYSGNSHKTLYKGAMAQDDKRRSWANEVVGKVAVGKDGNITNSSYASGKQKEMDDLANKGYDYVDIIVKLQGKGVKVIDSSCTAPSAVEGATEWKQDDSTWGSIKLGNSSETIKSAGCLVTSISMLIAKSGSLEMTPPSTIATSDFNPGTFVQALNKNGGFDAGGNFYWNKTEVIVPAFKHVGRTNLEGKAKSEKMGIITSKLNEGLHCVAEVKGNTGQHWVAIDRVESGKVYMHDPASTATDMWKQYNWKNTSTINCFTTK